MMIPQSRPAVSPREQFAIVPVSVIAALGDCTRAEILVHTALAAHADPSGHCWPGRERIASMTGLNPSRVSRATTGLQKKGLLRKEGAPGYRIDYYLLSPPLVIETAPVADPVSTPPAAPVSETAPSGVQNGTTPVSKTAPRTDHGIDQKRPERASAEPAAPKPPPAPAAPAPETPNGAHSGFVIQIRTSIADDWALPDDYRTWATEHRPDLADRLDGIADGFRDYHLSKGTRSANWQAEWRRWIHRERAPKPTQNARAATQTERRYQTPEQEAAMQEANKRAMEASEERRLEMMRSCGIDPMTGLKLPATPAAPPATPPATTPAAAPEALPEALPEAPETLGPSLPTLPTMPMPTTPEQQQRNQQRQWQFAHLVDQGKSLSEIREHLDPPAPAPRPARRLTAEQQAQFIELARSGMSLAEAKAKMGLC